MRFAIFLLGVILGFMSAVTPSIAQPNILAGQWRTDWGPAEVFRDGPGFHGTYKAENGNTDDDGTFVLTKKGKTWAGFWAEPSSNERCDTKRFGTYYWGRLKLGNAFSESGFDMNWGYCDDRNPSRLWVFNIKTGSGQTANSPPVYEASSVITKLKSGFWLGSVRSNAQGYASYCLLSAQKQDKEFTIQLYWNSDGFHVLIHSKNWSLNTGDTFQGRVRIDNRFDGLIEATIFNSGSIDYTFGFDIKAREALQRGSRISLEGPLGKKTFQLTGTRKAVDVLQACAQEYLQASDEPSVVILSDDADDIGKPFTLNILGDNLMESGRTVLHPGDQIYVMFTALSDLSDQSWIGFVADNADQSPEPEHFKQETIKNRTDGLMELVVPSTLGDYRLWMYDRANAIMLVEERVRIAVDMNSAALDLPAGAQLEPGQSFKVNFKASPNYTYYTWVAVLDADTPPDKKMDNFSNGRFYLENRADGTLTFTAPTVPGRYLLRMHESYFKKTLTEIVLTVADPGTTPTNPLPLTAGTSPDKNPQAVLENDPSALIDQESDRLEGDPTPQPVTPQPVTPVAAMPAPSVAATEPDTKTKPKKDSPPPGDTNEGVAGIWTIVDGNFKTIELDQVMGLVEGKMSHPNGRFEGELTSGQLTGLWASKEAAVGKPCATQRLGANNWGAIEAELSADGSKLNGSWGSCNQPRIHAFKAIRAGKTTAAVLNKPVPQKPLVTPSAKKVSTPRNLAAAKTATKSTSDQPNATKLTCVIKNGPYGPYCLELNSNQIIKAGRDGQHNVTCKAGESASWLTNGTLKSCTPATATVIIIQDLKETSVTCAGQKIEFDRNGMSGCDNATLNNSETDYKCDSFKMYRSKDRKSGRLGVVRIDCKAKPKLSGFIKIKTSTGTLQCKEVGLNNDLSADSCTGSPAISVIFPSESEKYQCPANSNFSFGENGKLRTMGSGCRTDGVRLKARLVKLGMAEPTCSEWEVGSTCTEKDIVDELSLRPGDDTKIICEGKYDLFSDGSLRYCKLAAPTPIPVPGPKGDKANCTGTIFTSKKGFVTQCDQDNPAPVRVSLPGEIGKAVCKSNKLRFFDDGTLKACGFETPVNFKTPRISVSCTSVLFDGNSGKPFLRYCGFSGKGKVRDSIGNTLTCDQAKEREVVALNAKGAIDIGKYKKQRKGYCKLEP